MHALRLMALVVALAAEALAQAPFAERFAARWRWRVVPPPPGLGEPRVVRAHPSGGIVVLFRDGVATYNGRRWQVLEALAEPVRVESASGIAACASGVILLTTENVWGLDHDGTRRRLATTTERPQALHHAADGSVHFVQGQTLYRLEAHRAIPICATPSGVLDVTRVRGQLWCTTGEGIYRHESGQWRPVELPASARVGAPRYSDAISTRSGHILFIPIYTNPAPPLLRWDGARLSAVAPPRTARWIRPLGVMTFGPLIVATHHGEPILAAPQRWIPLSRKGLDDDELRYLCFTRDRRIAVVTTSSKLLICDMRSRRWWVHETHSQGVSSVINALARSRRGGVWLGTDAGVARWNGAALVDVFREGAGIALTGVTAVHEDRDGQLWVGGGSSIRGVLRWDGTTWHHHREKDGVGDWSVHAIRPGRNGDVWFCLLSQGAGMGNEGGLVLRRNGRWHRFTARHGLPSHRTYDVFARPGLPPLVATFRGVAVRDGERWKPVGDPLNVFAVHTDHEGSVWAALARSARGLARLRDGQWHLQTTAWSDVFASTVRETVDGRLWCASNRGLFFRWQGIFHEPTREPGVPARRFWPLEPDRQGGVWLGSRGRGLVRYRPDDLAPPETTRVMIHRTAKGRYVLSCRAEDEWMVTPSHLLRYRWRVAGDAWSEPFVGGEIVLPDLPPGEYTIEVQAMDLAGNLEKQPQAHALVVPRPLHAKPWFVGLMLSVLGAAALVAAVLLGRRRARNREQRIREEARNAARSKLERFRALFDQADEAIFVIDPGTGRFIDVNDTVVRWLGYSREELLRMGPADIETAIPLATPMQWSAWLTRIRQADGSLQVEGAPRRKDGTVLPVELRMSCRSFAGSELLLVTARDISERKRAEETIRAAREPLELIAQHTSELLFVRSAPDGSLLFVSPSCVRLTGYTPREYAKVAQRIVVPDHPASQEYLSLAPRIARGDESPVPPYTVAIRHRDGGTRIQQVHENSVTFRGQRMLVGIAVDVTEIHKAQAALRHSEKLKSLGILAGGIVHNFNNLLVGVLGNAELAQSQVEAGSRVGGYLSEIDTAATRAAELCQQLLAYIGKGETRLERIDLSELVEEMTRLLQVSISKAIKVDVLLERDLPRVKADPAQLRQVVMNLVTNAAEAIGDQPGTIRVATGRMEVDQACIESCVGAQMTAGPHVFVEVRDTGCGMDAETRARIFDPFFTTKFAGRGLGLAAALGTVKTHRGGLIVDSRPGAGTAFRLLLPTTRHERILVVDDEPTVRGIAGAALREAGFEVVEAPDMGAAIETVRADGSGIRAVLFDVAGGPGAEATLAELRALRADLPVVVTGGGPAPRERGDAHLTKPYSPDELLTAVRSVLA